MSISFYTNFSGRVSKGDNLVYFENWMAGTDPTSIIDNPVGGTEQQAARFFDDIAKYDITIIQYDTDGAEAVKWNFYKVFPTSVVYDQLSYATKDALHSITVTFDVEDFVLENAGGSSGSSARGSSSVGASGAFGSSGPLGNLFNSLAGGGSMTRDLTKLTGGKVPNSLDVTKPGAIGESTGSFLSDIKSTYNSASNSVSGFFKDITSNLDPDTLNIAKRLASTSVSNAIRGVPTDFGREAKLAAAPNIGNMIARLSDDPSIKRTLKQSSSNVIMGMPDRVTSDARQSAISDLNRIINSI
jgi:hypothetical protein